MKSQRALAPAVILFILIFGLLFSLGEECFLRLSGVYLALPLDGYSPGKLFPRFIPFCWIAGGVCLLLIAFTLILNLKKANKLRYTKAAWILQWIGAFALSIPLMRLWDWVFLLLQQKF